MHKRRHFTLIIVYSNYGKIDAAAANCNGNVLSSNIHQWCFTRITCTHAAEMERDTHIQFVLFQMICKSHKFLIIIFSLCRQQARERERERRSPEMKEKNEQVSFVVASFFLLVICSSHIYPCEEHWKCWRQAMPKYNKTFVIRLPATHRRRHRCLRPHLLQFFNLDWWRIPLSLIQHSFHEKLFFSLDFACFFSVSHFICFKLNDSCFLLVTKRKRQLCVCVYTCVDREERISYFNCAWRDDTTHFVARRWSLSFSLSLLF